MTDIKDKINTIKYDSKGLVPAIAQDINTREVLMLAYMNKESLEQTLETGKATYYSRSRGEIWVKGLTSGNTQSVKEVLYDCDMDTLLVMVDQKGVACHTGARTCFFATIGEFDSQNSLRSPSAPSPMIISDLAKILKDRKSESAETSYTASLYKGGKAKIIKKIKEESDELIEAIEEKDNSEVVKELTDLWFHTMVALENSDIDINDVFKEFQRRFGTSGIEEKNNRNKK